MTKYPLVIIYYGKGAPNTERYYGTHSDAHYWAKIQANYSDAHSFAIYTQGGYLLASYNKKGSRWISEYKSYKWKV